MDCDPNNLSKAASCIRCLPDGLLVAARTVILCSWATVASGGAPNNARITEAGDVRITESGDIRVVA